MIINWTYGAHADKTGYGILGFFSSLRTSTSYSLDAIYEAIYAHFTDTQSDFYTDLTGRLYNHRAPQGATMPYCVYQVISPGHDWTFGDDLYDIDIQFAVYSTDAQEAAQAAGHCIELFDDCAFTIAGSTFLYMNHDSSLDRPLVSDRPEDQVIYGFIETFTLGVQF